MSDCDFNFVGDLTGFGGMCVISLQTNINTDYQDYGCEELYGGSRVGTLNLSAYSELDPYIGKPTRAGCQVLWIKKYSCDLDMTIFIFSGQGRSFSEKDTPGVSLNMVGSAGNTETLNASSSSGPYGLVSKSDQIEGIGMDYTGGPINFNSSTEAGNIISTPFVSSECYLQNFHIEFVPGSIPVANYVFTFIP